MQNKSLALKVAGAIFLVVAIMHLLRLLFKVQIAVAGTNVSLSLSLAAFVVALLLAIWMFKAGKN